jgi:hypothetical protein
MIFFFIRVSLELVFLNKYQRIRGVWKKEAIEYNFNLNISQMAYPVHPTWD